MRARLFRFATVLALSAALAGCGKGAGHAAGGAGPAGAVAAPQGAVGVSTKNTTRLGGSDPASDAAAVARAVYPGLTTATRPQAVVVVDEHDWTASLAAAALAAAPLGAPLLYADGDVLPAASAQALTAMRPLGAPALGGAQVIRIATAAPLPGPYRTTTVPAQGDPARMAAAVQRLLARVRGRPPRGAIVVDAAAPRALQMPAAGLAAESATPILVAGANGLAPATDSALARLAHPAIYLLGAHRLRGRALAALARLGHVVHVVAGSGTGTAPNAGEQGDPVANAIVVSRFADGPFGWGVHEAGHGLVFANAARPLDGPAAAPLSAHGDYGPLLLLSDSRSLPGALARYLSDIEPGYTDAVPPVREVYNHGWLIGDEQAISATVQAEVDSLLEIAPRKPSAEEPPAPPAE